MEIDVLTGCDADNLIGNTGFHERWKKLYDQCPWGTVYQSEPFVGAWYETYRSQYTPVIVVGLDDEGELVGLLTLAEATESGQLVVAGRQEAEYQAWLACPRDGNRFIESALQELSKRFPNRTLEFLFLPPNTPVEWVKPGHHWSSRRHIRSLRRGLMTVGDGGETKEALRKKQNKINRLKRLGDLRFERLQRPEELEAIFDEFTAYQTFRLKAIHNLTDLEDDPLRKPFYVNMMRRPGLLHVTALRLDDKLVSAQLHVCNKDQVLLGRITHSPLYAKFSPGTLHMLMLNVELAKQGVPVFDLTPGGEYKDRYATHYDEVYVLTIFFNRAHCLQYKLKRWLADMTKSALRIFNITPEQTRNAFSTFVDSRRKWSGLKKSSLMLELFRSLKRSLWRAEEACVYVYDLARRTAAPEAQLVKRDHIPDLLAYKPAETWQPSVNRFFKRALERLESGAHVYTRVEDERLEYYGWLIEPQGQTPITAIEGRLELPPDSALLADFYLHPQARSRGLFQAALSQMLRDAAETSGVKQVYVCMSAGDDSIRQAVEEAGFTYQSTFFSKKALGRTSSWSAVSDIVQPRRAAGGQAHHWPVRLSGLPDLEERKNKP
jgi:CelD/BcsL family acetyltransferase involved in cellulose biosynthesis/GNAT superfamily N-acetyltransferase